MHSTRWGASEAQWRDPCISPRIGVPCIETKGRAPIPPRRYFLSEELVADAAAAAAGAAVVAGAETVLEFEPEPDVELLVSVEEADFGLALP